MGCDAEPSNPMKPRKRAHEDESPYLLPNAKSQNLGTQLHRPLPDDQNRSFASEPVKTTSRTPLYLPPNTIVFSRNHHCQLLRPLRSQAERRSRNRSLPRETLETPTVIGSRTSTVSFFKIGCEIAVHRHWFKRRPKALRSFQPSIDPPNSSARLARIKRSNVAAR